MKFFSTSEARQQMTQLLNEIRSEPVVIRYHQRDTAVMMSVKEYQRLKALDNKLTEH